MLYELIAVVRHTPLRTLRSDALRLQRSAESLKEVREIVQTTGRLILSRGGTIRGLANWGVFDLPKPTHKHQRTNTEGHYFVMRFDASAACQDEVRSTLGLDPRMVKFSSVKLGEGTLESLARLEGRRPWSEAEKDVEKRNFMA